jgi:hypothetical protein
MDETNNLRILPPDAVPDQLRSWLEDVANKAVLVSLELLPDGRLVAQAMPEVDPRLVARVRRILAQHEDVLRRLT